MKTKRRGKQQGPTHRITMTFPENLFQALSDASDHYGYSISEIARRVIDRGVGAGLLHSETPTKKGQPSCASLTLESMPIWPWKRCA